MGEEYLDGSWVNKFKDAERHYNHFYKETPIAVDIVCLYVNANRQVVSVVKEKHQLLDDNGMLPKERLLEVIRLNEHRNGITYRVVAVAKYNFTIEPDELISMDTIDAADYFSSEKYLGNVLFGDTITLFQDVNALFLLFNEKGTRTRLTKHVRFHKPVRNTRRRRK